MSPKSKSIYPCKGLPHVRCPEEGRAAEERPVHASASERADQARPQVGIQKEIKLFSDWSILIRISRILEYCNAIGYDFS